MAAKGRQQQLLALGGGFVAGVFGGLVLSLYGLLASVAGRVDPWLSFKGSAAPFLGDRALVGGFDATAVVLGILVHFTISVLWGLVFGLIAYGLSVGATLLFGIVYGVVVWLGMYYVALPIVGLFDLARSVPILSAVISHVVFGLALAVGFLPFQKRSRVFYP